MIETTRHLPECPAADPVWHPDYSAPCICDRLRACEQRVENRFHFYTGPDVYAAALDAAREAVAALPYECFDVNSDPSDWLLREDVLDAIDALREGEK